MALIDHRPSKRPLVTAGIWLGLGLGGFFDGIVLHQILQWHHMVSVHFPPSSLDNLELNTLADGLFHAAAWLFTLVGVFTLWAALRGRSGRFSLGVLVGAMLIGWGLFNLVEGVVDHHLLNLHHVRPGPNQWVWDVAFLVWGAAMLVGGWLLIRGAPAYRPAQAPAKLS
jgi:uncharacterized membrane protein